MRKFKVLLFALFVCFLSISGVSADTTCKYVGNNKNGMLTVEFVVKDDLSLKGGECIVDGYAESDDEEYISADTELVDNWKKTKLGESQSGKEYFEDTGKCPPHAIWWDEGGLAPHFNVLVSNETDLNIFIRRAREKQGYQVLNLLDQNLVNKIYTINFVKNNDAATGSMNSIEATYGENAYIPDAGFKLAGFSIVGYRIYNNGKWKCRKGGYKSACEDEYDYEIVGSNSSTMIEFDPSDPNVYLYAEWKVNANINSQTVNQYNLGEGYCTEKGFVWNESNGGYCNTDNLQYVTCGDSYDIPRQVPQLVGYLVNLLKIATPIILIFVSMITLFKALIAPKEDEMKKAQSSLIKKIIAAALVFFVVSIVQFVVLKVADSSETKSISNCMSCFLNNDCVDTTYYKTNIGGVYYCTSVTQTGTGNIVSCNEFYKNIKSEFNTSE